MAKNKQSQEIFKRCHNLKTFQRACACSVITPSLPLAWNNWNCFSMNISVGKNGPTLIAGAYQLTLCNGFSQSTPRSLSLASFARSLQVSPATNHPAVECFARTASDKALSCLCTMA